MTSKNKKDFKEVLKAFYRISSLFESIHSGQYHNNIYHQYLTSEKNHVKCKPDSVKNHLTISQGAMFLYIHNIIEWIKKDCYIKDFKQILHIRTEYIQLYSLYLNYENEIKETLKDIDINLIYNMDYVALQNNN